MGISHPVLPRFGPSVALRNCHSDDLSLTKGVPSRYILRHFLEIAFRGDYLSTTTLHGFSNKGSDLEENTGSESISSSLIGRAFLPERVILNVTRSSGGLQEVPLIRKKPDSTGDRTDLKLCPWNSRVYGGEERATLFLHH